MILQKLIYLLHRPNRQIEWECRYNHHSHIFPGLDCSTNLCNPSGVLFYFLLTLFGDRRSSKWFHVAFPTRHHATGQRANWGFCQLLIIHMPIIHYQTGGITTGWVQGPTWLTLRCNWTKTVLISGLQKSPLADWLKWCFESLGTDVNSKPMSSSL